MSRSLFTHLECSKTGETFDADTPQNLSRVGAPLLARYDLAHGPSSPAALPSDRPGLWRYAPLLPVRDPKFIAYLGEGGTPLLPAPRLGFPHLTIKEESVNPTGSFKARGMAVAVARAAELGIRAFAVGSAGNAGSALGAYVAALGLEAHIAMPRDTPASIVAECRSFGVDLALIDGLITDANAHVQKGVQTQGWFDMATLREPYRLEGKKTMGYELFEQLGGQLPDVIVYPTGGGTGLIGMWKAFEEMEQLGWIGPERPRMISVQAAGCAPIVRAFEAGATHAAPWENASTSASGLRVPRAIGDFLILEAVRRSGGSAVAVTEEEMFTAWRRFSAATGLFCAPEGAATLAALEKLVAAGAVARDERIVLFNTGSGLKYLEAWEKATLSPEAPSLATAGVSEAVALAAQKHKGQSDRAGALYLLHPLRVLLNPVLTSDDERMAAVLHDVVEDCGVTLDDLRTGGFSESVVEMVAAVTKRPEEADDYAAFITRVLSSSPGAMRVKLADLEDNMNLDRLPVVTEKDQARLERYREATRRIQAALAAL